MKKTNKSMPGIQQKILERILIDAVCEGALGDIEERYRSIARDKSAFTAGIWLWMQILQILPAYVKLSISTGISMIINYLKTSVRNMLKYKGYSLISILGLSLGIAGSLLIFIYVKNELSYDRFHENKDRVFRVVTDIKPPGDAPVKKFPTTEWPVPRILRSDYPEVERTVEMCAFPLMVIKHKGSYYTERQFYADENFFSIFTFPLKEGSPETALKEPYTVVLSEKLARKYFGNEDAVGKTLTMNDSLSVTVSGVLAETKNKSHLQFDMILSYSTALSRFPHYNSADTWGNVSKTAYIQLRKDADAKEFEKKISGLIMEQAGDKYHEWGYDMKIRLEPLPDIYLYSGRSSRTGSLSDIRYIRIFTAIGLFLLLIGCINFVNLATSRSAERLKEVGVRKAMGSSTGQLFRQFISETFITCSAAFFLALLIIAAVFDRFLKFTGISLQPSDLISVGTVIFVVLFLAGISLISGGYPAVLLSRLKPAFAVKGAVSSGSEGKRLRQGLVILQFVISCVLIISTLTIKKQFSFLQDYNLGFQKEGIIVLNTSGVPSNIRSGKWKVIKDELLKSGAVRNVSAVYTVPGIPGWSGQICFPEGRNEDDGVMVEYLAADRDYVKTFGLKIVAGRDFNKEMISDKNNSLIINVSAVREMGWGTPQNAIGKRIESPSGYPAGKVIGVIGDYHHHSLKKQIGPVALDVNTGAVRFFAVRTENSHIPEALEHIKTVWKEMFPGYEFNYFFLDERFDRQYAAEQRMSFLIALFAGVSIVIACLGLIGLAAFTVIRRRKEIGIRKVLGASETGIFFLLSREFLMLILIAFAISAPIGYYWMHRWLQNYAYRAGIGAGVFIAAGFLTVFFTYLSITWQALRASVSNPVNAIKYE